MHLKDINGGFFASLRKDAMTEEISARLRQMGAGVEVFNDEGLILAAWKNQPGQGIWANGDLAIAYDMDLTNEKQLSEKIAVNTPVEKGQMLGLLYQSHGMDFIAMLKGPFAFALFDRKRRKMIVASDAFGIRPVVYGKSKGGFTAGSRIKYALADKNINTEIDPEAIYHYLFFQAICTPATIYKGVRKLPPGEGLEVKNGEIKPFVHYDIKYNPDRSKGESYWCGAIRDAVEKAVGVFVPLSEYEKTGCYLSGGTDSSSVAGNYTRISGKPAKTFSIGFDEPEYNELDYAHIASRHFGTMQHDYMVAPENVLDLINELPNLYDEPFGNSSVVPAFFCARFAKENGVDILLGGDGGDEIFGGNERYVQNLVFSIYSKLPQAVRKSLLEPLLSIIPDGVAPIYKAKRYVRRANIPNPDRFYSYNLLAENPSDEIFHSDFLKTFDNECFLNLARRLYKNAAPADDTDRLLYLDMKFTITDNDLRKVTRMAEAAGIQVRYPLLDRDLADFTATIPPGLKVKWGKGRYVFKRAMEGFLPEEIIKKKKHGMGLPIAIWFKKDSNLYELLNDTLFSGQPRITRYVKPSFIEQFQNKFINDDTTYYGSNLWVFLMLELWLANREV